MHGSVEGNLPNLSMVGQWQRVDWRGASVKSGWWGNMSSSNMLMTY